MYDPLNVVASKYLNTTFTLEIISLFPWGYIMATFDPKFKVFWLVKAIRIGQLNQYLGDRSLLPIINSIFEKKEKKDLKEMCYDTL